MRYVGKGFYHAGPGGIEQPGDFGWRIDLGRERIDGIWRDKIVQIQFAQHCPKFGVCLIKVHQAPRDQSTATWWWNGSYEAPTIRPSIGCDNAPRCGAHRTITDGIAT